MTRPRLTAALAAAVALALAAAAHAQTCTPADPYVRHGPATVGAGAGDRAGAAVAYGDFNDDGRDDLLVGAPKADVGTAVDAGAVHLYMSTGTGYAPGRLIVQSAADGANEAGDEFGSALAVGDFNEDGVDDALVGGPLEDFAGPDGQLKVDAGAIFILPGRRGTGTAGGLGLDRGFFRVQADVAGETVELGDRFGAAVAAGDVDGDGDGDVVAAAPYEDVGTVSNAGIVAAFPVEGTAPLVGFARTQEAAGVGASETDDRFGTSLASGNVTGDGGADVVIGAPNEAPGALPRGGAIFVLQGLAGGTPGTLLKQGYVRLQEDAEGATEAGDQFGQALAVADLGGDATADIAIGAPGEAPGSAPKGGALFVLVSGGDPDFYVSQASGGGDIEEGDRFGASLAAGDFDADADAHRDLAVGAPGENNSGGAVSLLTSAGTRAPDAGPQRNQTQLGSAHEALDEFAASLAAGDHDGDGRADLGVGSPGENQTGIASIHSGLTTLSLGGLVGEVTETTAKVWARAGTPASLRVQYRPQGTTSWATSTAATLDPAADHTAVVSLTGLQANTVYDYRLVVGCDADRFSQATFRTLPARNTPGVIRFAFGADTKSPNDAGGEHFRAFDSIAGLAPHLMILGGDQVYGDSGRFFADSTPEYDRKYRENWAEPHFRAFTTRFPTFMVWDDHEIVNDWRSGTAAPYPAARVAYQTYQNAHNPGPRVAGELYYSFRAGGAAIYVLDTRTHRNLGAGTMLGAQQKADLKAWLSDPVTNQARFKFIVSSVPWNDASTTGNDSWFGYKAERGEIFSHIRNNNIRGVVLISGDQHWSGAFLHKDAPPLDAHPYNLYEFMPTPLAVGRRPMCEQAPFENTPCNNAEVTTLFKYNLTNAFGLFDVDTTVAPARLTARFYTDSGVELRSFVITEDDISAP
ncbi:MAG: alkaline phosphatase D family protein [Actinomycetota bacterium]|nr:alkaline phosphatase D family protein [Actinomycetota bacterium]